MNFGSLIWFFLSRRRSPQHIVDIDRIPAQPFPLINLLGGKTKYDY